MEKRDLTDNESYGKSGIIQKQKTLFIVKELFRKSIHICSASLPFLLRHAYWLIIILLLLVVAVYIFSEIQRMKGVSIPLISSVTAAAARKRDEGRFVLGPVTLVAGIVLAALIFPPECAALGIYALSFGDGLASVGGKLFGRIIIPFTDGKTVAGSLTCFTAIFISAWYSSGSSHTALVLALVGMFIELLPLKDFDNLIIPLAIGGTAFLL
ncbi:MAG: phosphatidate cytidylyltransferase [Treponema sp.]|nr:phosphatidate cytidylyltransferase [Treponema sp.]